MHWRHLSTVGTSSGSQRWPNVSPTGFRSASWAGLGGSPGSSRIGTRERPGQGATGLASQTDPLPPRHTLSVGSGPVTTEATRRQIGAVPMQSDVRSIGLAGAKKGPFIA